MANRESGELHVDAVLNYAEALEEAARLRYGIGLADLDGRAGRSVKPKRRSRG